MAIWYIDYVNGLDSNNGNSWVTAFKTLNAVTAAKGFVTGDTVRFAKSPDPTSLGQTAQWTDQSKTVTLTTPVTQNIDLCDVAWTKAAASSANSLGSGKQNNYASITMATMTANTLQAYHGTGVLDLSAYQQVSFWINTSVAVVNNTSYRICLCSDTAGQNILYSFTIPPLSVNNCWNPIAVDLGAPIIGAIQSVALYSGSTPQGGTVTISLDNILACKAPSAPDALTLLSLISKNNGTDAWFPIQSINDTAIMLDNYVTLATSGTRPYAGTTENITTYKREATRTALATATTAAVQSIALPITVTVTLSGGWNTSTGLQDSETFFDGQNSMGAGITLGIIQITYFIENISLTRYNIGFNITTAPYPGSTFKLYQLVACTASALICNASPGCYCTVTVTNVVGNNIGINGFANSVIKVTNAISNSQAISGANIAGNILTVATCRLNQYGIWFSATSGQGMLIKDSLFANNSNTDIIPFNCYGSGPILLDNVLYQTTQLSSTPTNLRIISQNDQRVPGATKIWGYNHTIVNDTTIVHTAGGMSWKMTGTTLISYPAWLVIGRIWCPANQSRTFSAWLRRDNVSITGALAVRGNFVSGIPNNVTTNTMTTANNVWEQFFLSVTPTVDAVIEVEAWSWGNGSVWVAEFSAS